VIHIAPQAAGYKQTELENLYRTIEAQFHTLPGVVKVGISTYTPMEDNNWSNGVQIQGEPDPDKGASFVKPNSEYFDAVGTHVLMGRGITPQDTLSAPPIAVVNKEFVKQFFKPGANPIGHRMGSPGPDTAGSYEIVGVVDDTTYTAVQWKDHAMYFVPITQRAAKSKEPIEQDISLFAGAIVVQTDRPMNDMEKLAQRTLSGINPNLTIVKFQTFDQQIADRFTDERMIARLTSLFGGLALLLATIGLYGVTAYTVVRRTPEIGIRMALGAARTRVIGMVMRGAMTQAALGLVVGAPIAILCVRYVKSQLYEITHVDPSVMIGAIAVLIAAACVAGMIPARRASSINPVQALRIE
jgi:predicted permease